MSTMTNDAPTATAGAAAPNSRLASGIGFALLAAMSFGVSGSLAKGLMDLGWTAGSAVLLRVTIAALVLAVPGAMALRGRWHLLARSVGPIVAYGLFAVAGAQLFYFMAVQTLDVSIAMLIEYLAPVAVVLYLWVRKGQKPTRFTAIGAVIAAFGLVLLINVFGGAQISLSGIGWALGAMVGATVYFIVSADDSNPLPPITLAASGLAVAAVALGLAALVGFLPMGFGAGDVQFQSFAIPAWLAVGLLGVVTAAIAYVAGIAATRRLGARLGSFVALTEVLAAAVFAWVLLGQAPAAIQMLGAALVLAGVVVVKLGEPPMEPNEITVEPLPVPRRDELQEPVAV
ncbi:EamA family transporter [Demequina sp.]|uniref:EamA family transporter n=1 Tax=Demequina sp. TaxID=2050685 RepID=UPI003D10B61E